VSGKSATGAYVTAFVPSTTTIDIAGSSFDSNGVVVVLYSSTSTYIMNASVRGSRFTRNRQSGFHAQWDAGASVRVAATDNTMVGNVTGISVNGAGA